MAVSREQGTLWTQDDRPPPDQAQTVVGLGAGTRVSRADTAPHDDPLWTFLGFLSMVFLVFGF